MSTLNDATSRNVSEKQQQQGKEENTREQKDGYENAQKDKHKKRHEKKKNSNATATTTTQATTNIGGNNSSNSSSSSTSSNTNSICNLSNITLATQFSIQRTDSDGCLRMKISAIRPTTTITAGGNLSTNSTNFVINPSAVQKNNYSKSKNIKEEKQLLKNNTLDTSLKVKISPTLQDKPRIKAETKPTNMSSVIVNPLAKNRKDILQLPLTVPMAVATTTMTCLSDATDSGCSEATNTTIATVGQEKISKRKIKRKKALLKANETKRALKSLKPLEITTENAFSTDSEDEPLAQKLLVSNVEAITQRAPRLLLTAINTKSMIGNLNATSSHLQNTLGSLQHGNDHIGLSSSDNELPNVRAAIERVVGESDEDDNMSSSHFHKAKTKHLPQYQSTLLQDFMEKTQMLGQAPKSSDNGKPKNTVMQNEILLQLNTNSQTDSIASSSASNNKKRRGRPKKPDKEHELTLNSMSPVHVNNKTSNINESADSGVISTTSVSTQSTSPHPCTTLASSAANDNTSSTNSPNKNLNTTPEKHANENLSSSSNRTPKIDIALLDKRMYATERVLYPPPRNKRRQSTSAALASMSDKPRSTSSQVHQQTSKDDLQLDPVWRKIDINRKFRRPSVCSTTGYKSDGGADERVRERSSKSTVCSKVLAAKSGYVSDYGTSSFRLSRHSKHASHNSGYKSDVSCKSRYSTKSCASRKSRAKSCGYRSDCKESVLGSSKSSKFRRKRRASIMQKSMGSLKDEQDILQLAGLSLGQSSEESNEYVCKPSLEKLPTTSASKKYGEINRYIATGEYFGRGSSSQTNTHNSFASISNNSTRVFDVPTDLPQTPAKINLLQRKNSTTSEFAHDLLQLPGSNQTARKIKSRRSSVASFCSSYYSAGTTKRRRRRRKSFRFHNSSSSKNSVIDSKLLTEIEILTNTFSARCRIQSSSLTDKLTGGNLSQKEKLMAEATKLQQSLAAAAAAASTSASTSSKRDSRDKRSVKKRKISENLDFAMLSARAESNSLTPGSSSGQGTSSKRRHKKASSSSPDDHKLPLKKRHYLLTPGDKSSEVAVAVAAKLFANNAEAWAAAAAAAKTTANTKSQQQFNAKTAKANLTPKKRHLLQQPPHTLNEDSNSNKTASTLSPLRVTVGDPNSISGGKLLDISPQSLNSLKQVTEAVNKKRSRLEGVVSKIATNHGDDVLSGSKTKSSLSTSLQIESESSSCPPPGVFEPSVELEIQIPPITKLAEATSTIITKSEVDSPLLMDLNKGFSDTVAKNSGTRVVESLLNKTGGNLILKRKRKKINRTGFPTVKRKKRKINENLILGVATDVGQQQQTDNIINKQSAGNVAKSPEKQCDRVPQQGETSQTFLERNNRTPRLSVVALERLQESPLSTKDKTSPKETKLTPETASTPKTRHTRHVSKRKIGKDDKLTAFNKELKSINEKEKSIQSQQQQQDLEQDDDDKPLAARVRRTKSIPETKSAKSTPSRKSLVSKTAKSLLESNIKLPAGVDPKSILSCKIKLKRRNSIHPLAARKSPVTLPVTQPIIEEIPRTPEEIEMDAKAKDCNIDYLEHDILPINESQLITFNGDTEASDTSDEKSSTNSSVTKKLKMIKKSYLPAGLFSDYFKVNQTVTKKNINKKDNEKKQDIDKTTSSEAVNGNATKDAEIVKLPLLPPPPYCERYLRRTVYDFELPYDIWWAYKNAKLPNRNTVPSWNFRKIRTNIYAENVKPPPIGANDHPMCNCKADVGCGDNCLNRMVYTECSPSNCPTREKCRNQKIQKHDIAPGVERFMTENKGWGVRTKLPIEKGTYILEYVGEVVTEREFKDRMATIYLNDTHHYCLHLDGGLVIDGQRMGSDCRFVNHSCEPNCEMQKWSVNGLSRMALFAKRNIAEGEELTYDYNFSLFNPSEGQPCRCNTPNCRGVIGGKSQRVKPLPVEAKSTNEVTPKDDRKGRQRKRKARKNTQRQTTKDVATPTRMQPLTEKEKKIIKQYSIFLIRNFEKIRAKKAKRKANAKTGIETKSPTPTNLSTLTTGGTPAVITQRRPSTPASLAAQISALCTARNIKTRGLTLAVQDPEVEKMAKMAKILRDICTNMELTKNPENEQQTLVSVLQNPIITGVAGSNKKKKASLNKQQKQVATDLKTIQNNIEQGYYKLPAEFNADMHKLFEEAKTNFGKKEDDKLKLIELLEKSFIEEKQKHYAALLELLGDESLLKDFAENCNPTLAVNTPTKEPLENNSTSNSPLPLANNVSSSNEDIIRCICGLFRDEGLMIQCARCMVWQHTECTKADINADNYLCEQCEPREVDREIPLDDYTEEGYRYYLTLMRGTSLQVRQGDAVYVLRDIPVKDASGNVVKKHTYETIGDVDYNECDIFRVERLWKDDTGKRFIFGHHFLRPHETFHEPSRKFYPNEVVRVPLYEVVPIDLVMGRCWVLDRTTFCKGRPIECNDETHCFICELRVDKSARFFSKAKTNHPTCTKSYAFRKFNEKLKISKTYAPHDVDPSMLKPKKQKTELDNQTSTSNTTTTSSNSPTTNALLNSRTELNKTPQNLTKKRQGSKSPATVIPTQTQSSENSPAPAPQMTVKEKRTHLENVLKTIKFIRIPDSTQNNEPPLDLSYLLTGRGARQRKTLTSSINSN